MKKIVEGSGSTFVKTSEWSCMCLQEVLKKCKNFIDQKF